MFRLRYLGVLMMLVGISAYIIGLLFTPIPPFLFYEETTTVQRPFNPYWPHSAPEMNSLATIGFDVAILGAILAIIGILKPRFWKKTP
jgi:hypothetical protein